MGDELPGQDRFTDYPRQNPPHTYRYAGLIGLTSLLFFILFVRFSLSEGVFGRRINFLILATIVTVVSMVPLIWVFQKLVPIQVVPGGLHAYNGFGLKVFCDWTKVQSVRWMFLFFGVDYLLIVDGRNVLICPCLPLFVRDKARLFSEVRDSAGPDHPVTKALERRLGLKA
ncbi:MAG: hypothetical protein JNM34_08370 [Chthonomonadaceae bacterium]|nr:hypothetical protein [Chthonomonadaceae bacterium]